MNRLRQVSLPVLAAVCLAGLPACSSNNAEHAAKKAGNKAEKAGKKVGKKAEKQAKKAKKDVSGY
jgi:hypothetical protein